MYMVDKFLPTKRLKPSRYSFHDIRPVNKTLNRWKSKFPSNYASTLLHSFFFRSRIPHSAFTSNNTSRTDLHLFYLASIELCITAKLLLFPDFLDSSLRDADTSRADLLLLDIEGLVPSLSLTPFWATLCLPTRPAIANTPVAVFSPTLTGPMNFSTSALNLP